MTAQMQISFYVTDETRHSELVDRLELTAATHDITLGTVTWSDPHERDDLPGQWVTATAPITRQPEHPKKGKRR